MKTLPDTIAPWLQGRMHSLGTDGFGRSENREHLRKFFEVSAEAMVQATLSALARWGNFDAQRAQAAVAEMGMDAEKKNPARL
jgi:pyruvate dehydrogenase E1 component